MVPRRVKNIRGVGIVRTGELDPELAALLVWNFANRRTKIAIYLTDTPMTRSYCARGCSGWSLRQGSEGIGLAEHRSGRMSNMRYQSSKRRQTKSPWRSAGGFSLVELLVTISIFGILVKVAVPHLDRGRMQITTAQRLVIAQLRLARANAISKSVHFRVEFPARTQIKVERMLLVGGAWQIDVNNIQTVTLPTPVQLASTIVGSNVEFNTRGLAGNLVQPLQINMTDSFGVTKSLQAWPSGQVNEL